MPERGWRRAALVPVLLAALTGCGGDADGATRLHGTVLEQPHAVSSAPLTDTAGRPFSLTGDTDRRLTLVFFGYTRCPDICQLVMGSLASAMRQLDERDREDVEVVFVTTDPARDTPRVLRDYLDRFDPSFVGLTGDIDTIAAVGRSVAVGVTAGSRLPSGGYDLSTHSTQVTAVDSEDQAPVYWDQNTSSAQFAQDVHTLLTGQA